MMKCAARYARCSATASLSPSAPHPCPPLRLPPSHPIPRPLPQPLALPEGRKAVGSLFIALRIVLRAPMITVHALP